MAITLNDLSYEQEVLKEKKNLINNEINIKTKKNDELESKIASLKKDAKGKYNEELDTMEKLYNVTSSSIVNYKEAIDKPYFGRVDFRERKKDCESFYIGKIGIMDSIEAEEVVVDWRAPIADLYYSGTIGDVSYEAPDGWIDGELKTKRKFIIEDGEIKDAFDEGNELIIKGSNGDENLIDEFLKINLEESSSTKLKEVVATIQKEQNDIIRAPLNSALIIQGSAGSGKTTVALHRLAYLLYKYRRNLTGNDILVVAPNKMFLDYISNILPSLGVDKVKQYTMEQVALNILKMKTKYISKEEKLSEYINGNEDKDLLIEASRFKGSIEFRDILDNYIEFLEKQEYENIYDIKCEGFVLFKATEIRKLYVEDMKNLSLNKRKEEIRKYFLKKKKIVLGQVFEKLDMFYDLKVKKIKRDLEDSEERRKMLTLVYNERDEKKASLLNQYKSIIEENIKVYNVKNIYTVYKELFFNEEIADKVQINKISPQLLKYIKESFDINDNKKIIDGDDIIAMAYLISKINGIDDKNKFRHIVIDEAQDYSPLAFSMIKEICSMESFTVVGDLAQGIYFFKGITDWNILKEKIFKNSEFIYLKQSYRSTVEIIDYANKIFRRQKLNFEPSRAVLRHGKEVKHIEVEAQKDMVMKIDDICEDVLNSGKRIVAVTCKSSDECKKVYSYLRKNSNYSWTLVKDRMDDFEFNFMVIPSYMTKGLEFDCSIVINENSYEDNIFDNKLLYVVLTRALHFQYIIDFK